MHIELLYFVLMIGAFLVCSIRFKLSTGLSMFFGALVGAILFGFFYPETFLQIPRHLVDGMFGYIDPVLTIVSAMIFMKMLEAAGTLDAFSVLVIEKLHKTPTILLIVFMFIIMFPSMITGSSVTSVVSAGALVFPVMLALGIPKKETVAIVAAGGIFGMIAPPINIPVMVIADIVDMPYTGFTIPLLLLTIPPAIFTVLYLGRKFITKVDLEELKKTINFDIKKEVNPYLIYLPLILLIVLMSLVNLIPQHMPTLGMPLVFLISAVPALFVGKKVNILKQSKKAIQVTIPVMAMLMGIGMLIQIMTLTGARGYIVVNVMELGQLQIGHHPILLYLGSAIFIPAFGAISPFGSASVFGGPFVLGLQAVLNPIIVASAMSMLASVGDFLPPSAIAGRTAARVVGLEENYTTVLPKVVIPIVVIIVYSVAYMIIMGTLY